MKLKKERLVCASRTAAFCLLVTVFIWPGQRLESSIKRLGSEYSVLGRQIGDQFFPKLAVNDSGGYLVWQDNNVDGDGLGISAVKLDANFNAVQGVFRVNQAAKGEQQRPTVTLLGNGGAAFAWESNGDIFVRFVNSDGVFIGPEQTANTYLPSLQRDPAMAALKNDNVVVVWGSMGQDGSLQGVFGQIFDPQGNKIGKEFMVSQSTLFNQRSPAVAALPQGNFVVSWISERLGPQTNGGELTATGGERHRVNLYGRVFDEHGNGVTNELLWGEPSTIDANPAVAVLDDGFAVFTSGHDNVERVFDSSEMQSGWDIYGRAYDFIGAPRGERFLVNQTTYNHQMIPAVASLDGSVFVTWTSVGQDGHREGVFGRIINPSAPLDSSPEFPINTETGNQQMLPTVAGGGNRALLVWSGFSGGRDSFDLKAQKYTAGSLLPEPDPPFVFGAGFWSLGVSWMAVEGVESYEVYLNDADAPVIVSENAHTFTGLNAGTEHSVRIAYVFSNGEKSTQSSPGVARTWGRDENFDGLPDEWQRSYWGEDADRWPDRNSDSDGDGASNFDELLAGTNPSDSTSLLQTAIISSGQGLRLRWNTQPGGFYQVKVSTDVRSWFDVGTPRLAVDVFDSISIGNNQGIAVYRVLRLK